MKSITKKSKSDWRKYPLAIVRNPFVWLSLFCISINYYLSSTTFENTYLYPLVFLCVGLIAIGWHLYSKQKLTAEKIVVLLFIAGFAVRVLYALRMGHWERQHDSTVYTHGDGHMAYIQYFLSHDFQLPDFDPREVWSFYHPPLFHFVAAVFIKISAAFYTDLAILAESVQTLTLFFSGCTTLVCLKMAKMLGLHGKGYVIAAVVIIFHPINIMVGSSINNDGLCFLLMSSTLYWGMKWYHDSSMKNIIVMALLMGCSVLAKTSGIYVAAPLAFLFLYQFFTAKQWKKFFLQYAVFAIIAIPIGVAWVTRCYLLFDMPFRYVPMMDETHYQYVGAGWYRLFDFGAAQWASPFIEVETHNIFVALTKTSIFGEWDLGTLPEIQVLFANIFFAVTVVLVCLSFVAGLYAMVCKNGIDPLFKKYLAVSYVVIFGAYIVFCFQYAHICTMNYRYIPITYVIASFALGVHVQEKRPLQGVIVALVASFASLSTLYYMIACMV